MGASSSSWSCGCLKKMRVFRGSDCPLCAGPTDKVVFLGMPGRLCEACACLTGLAGWAAWALPITTYDEDGEEAFAFMVYDGAYLPALWRWLRG